jgi:hypothetical protein
VRGVRSSDEALKAERLEKGITLVDVRELAAIALGARS